MRRRKGIHRIAGVHYSYSDRCGLFLATTGKFPDETEKVKIKILTIQDLLGGATVKMPPAFGTFKQAQHMKRGNDVAQGELDL